MNRVLSILASAGRLVTKKTKYSLPVRTLVNKSPFDVEIHGENVSIARGCEFSGRISLGSRTTVEKNCKLHGDVTTEQAVTICKGSNLNGFVSLGKWTDIREQIDITGKVYFGNYCAIGRRSTFISRNHPTSKPSIKLKLYDEILKEPTEHISRGPIEVGHDVWVGAEVMVLSGVTIGNGAVIGGGSVVTRDVEPYEIVAGAPAENRGWRFDKPVQKKLEEIEWWHWSERRMKMNTEFFTTDIESVQDIETTLVE